MYYLAFFLDVLSAWLRVWQPCQDWESWLFMPNSTGLVRKVTDSETLSRLFVSLLCLPWIFFRSVTFPKNCFSFSVSGPDLCLGVIWWPTGFWLWSCWTRPRALRLSSSCLSPKATIDYSFQISSQFPARTDSLRANPSTIAQSKDSTTQSHCTGKLHFPSILPWS